MLKNFRTLDQAKKDLRLLQQYIQMIETYTPTTIEEHTVFQYAMEGNVGRTAKKLRGLGFDSYKGATIESEIVTKIITSTPKKHDALHKVIRTLYLKKTRPARRKFT